jgi:hypothetical protein
LKHTQKHEKRRGGIEPKSKAARLWRTVRPGGADCPHEPRGLSANVPRTVGTGTADRLAWTVDCPLKPTEPPVANPEKGTVRGEHADCPPGTRGPSETSPNQNSKTQRNENEGEQEHEEHMTNNQAADRPPHARGLYAPCRTEQKTARPRRSTPPIHHRISQTVEVLRQEFGDMKSINQRYYTPKILPPNFLNHQESRIL